MNKIKAVILKTFDLLDLVTSKAIIISFKLLHKLSINEAYQSIPELNIKGSQKADYDSTARWEAIKDNLPADNPLSVLDIGCHTGFYSIKMAQLGHFVTGLEGTSWGSEFTRSAGKVLGLNNLVVANMYLTPENVNALPQYNCVFFFNVFHHLCVAYGKDIALRMLDVIYNKTDKYLFFQTGQPDTDPKFKESLPDMDGSPKEWMINLFKQKGAVHVEAIGKTRKRHLIAVHKI